MLLRETFEERFQGMPGLRVLVVDDEKVIADTLVQILTQDGYTAAAAYSGVDAIHCAREDHFDVVLMDVMMPAMSGIEAGKRLVRSTPNAKSFWYPGTWPPNSSCGMP
jgi:CheY-like chemotaxis protein